MQLMPAIVALLLQYLLGHQVDWGSNWLLFKRPNFPCSPWVGWRPLWGLFKLKLDYH